MRTNSICGQRVLVSIPFSVEKPSLVYASGVAVYSRNGAALNQAFFEVELVNAATNTTQATAGRLLLNNVGDDSKSLALQGVLRNGRAGTDAYDPSATTFVAIPGQSYLLRLEGQAGGTCSDHPKMSSVALSYILIPK